MIFSFVGFLLVFTLIGLSSHFKSRQNSHDYYLASGEIKPWLVGLSAVATNNSGYMFIGVIGYTYTTGLASIWLMIGWITGDFLASLFAHKQIKAASIRSSEITYAGVLSTWQGYQSKKLQKLIGLVSLLFLLTYASAQLLAGSKALHVLLGWPVSTGAIVGFVLVTLYCLVGGIRASIWTDAAQSFVMIIAMALLLGAAIISLGGPQQALSSLNEIEGYMNLFPTDLAVAGLTGGIFFIVGWLFAGLSVIGQPHIMVRFMTLNDNKKMYLAKIWYYLWFIAFYSMATLVGLLSRLYFPETASFDSELALPYMAQMLLNPALTGLILAGIFAATMSTADSLIISCSATFTHDLFSRKIENSLLIKASTIVIAFSALLIALLNNQSVFSLVIFSWSALASAFAPLFIFLCFKGKPTETASITALLCGLGTAISWRMLDLHTYIYEGLPGILVGLLVLILAQRINTEEVLSEQI